MNTFKTPKGTHLPFLNLKGKDYLQVAHRIVWFREEHPDWTIETNIHTLNEQVAIVSAEINDSTGHTLARGHKMQTAKGFPGGYLEKAESGAVGRALAFLGYGTAFAQELEDEDTSDLSTFADSPIPPKSVSRETKPVDKSTCAHKWLKSKFDKTEEWCVLCKTKRKTPATPLSNGKDNHATEDVPF